MFLLVLVVSLAADCATACGQRFSLASGCLTVTACLFESLSSSEQGGAIYVDSENDQVSITSTAFVSCASTKQGGACSLFQQTQTIERCCFFNCSASAGHALYLSILNSGQLVMRATTFFACASSVAGTHGTVSFKVGHNTATDSSVGPVNFTGCEVAANGAAFDAPADYVGALKWKYGLATKCKGSSIFFASRDNANVESVDFYGNTASLGVICTGGAKGISVSYAYFVEDSPLAYCTNSGNGMIQFQGCLFSGAAPSSYAQIGAIANCANTIGTSRTYTGFDTWWCAVTAVLPPLSATPVATPSERFTDGFAPQVFKLIAFGWFLVPMELVW
jgi:hypothetical protein